MKRDAARGARRRTPGAILPASFYARETEIVARELLGCIVESHGPRGFTSGRIVETEAYLGEHDPACHAAAGRTRRTDPLYGPPGTAYVYFCYGTHWLLNAVTRPEGLPSAVLIRALEPLDGIDLMYRRRPTARRDRDLASGPGKLCAALGLDQRHNRLPLNRRPVIIRHGAGVADGEVVVTPRIGIREAADWPLRWCVGDHDCLSRRQSPVTSHQSPFTGNKNPRGVNGRRGGGAVLLRAAIAIDRSTTPRCTAAQLRPTFATRCR